MRGMPSGNDLLARIKDLKGSPGDAGSASAWRDLFFDLSSDMLCVTDMDGRFLHLSPAWKRTLGREEKELLDGAPLERTRDRQSRISRCSRCF